jgi:hypothetical protein
MTNEIMDFSTELARYVVDALQEAIKNGHLTDEDLDRAKEAMRSGAVSAHRRSDGTFTITIGGVAAIDGHIFDLLSIAAEWETAAS